MVAPDEIYERSSMRHITRSLENGAFLFSWGLGKMISCDFLKLLEADPHPRRSAQDAHKLILHGVLEAHLNVGIQPLIADEFGKFPKDCRGCRE